MCGNRWARGSPAPSRAFLPLQQLPTTLPAFVRAAREPGNECTQRADTLAGSCQSPRRKGISKPCEERGEQSQPRVAGEGGKEGTKQPRGSVERGGGRAGGWGLPPPCQHAALGDKPAELLGPRLHSHARMRLKGKQDKRSPGCHHAHAAGSSPHSHGGD